MIAATGRVHLGLSVEGRVTARPGSLGEISDSTKYCRWRMRAEDHFHWVLALR